MAELVQATEHGPSMHSERPAYSTSEGFFRTIWRTCKEHARTVETLQFYFLRACTPLTAAQLAHLTSSGRLVFGSAPLPAVANGTSLPLSWVT